MNKAQTFVFRTCFFTLQWWKLFFGLFFMPIYSWVVSTSSCMYCDLGRFGYAGEASGFIAPYGLFWYLFYHSISFNYLSFVILLWIFDTAVFTVVLRFQHPIYIYFFTVSSLFFFFVNPADLFIFWLAVLGKEAPVMSIISAISKLPWPAPLWVWDFVFKVSLPSSLDYLVGLPRYILLGLWIIHGPTITLFQWSKVKMFERMS